MPYLKGYPDRHGKPRYYVRRKGFKEVALPGEPASKEWLDAYHAAVGSPGETKRPTPGIASSQAGTANALLVEFYGSDYWRHTLKENTQRTYRRIYEKWRAEWGGNAVKDLTKRDAQLMVDAQAQFPMAARSFLKRLVALFDFAIEREYRLDNPFRLIKLRKIESEGFAAWSDADIEAFKVQHPSGSKARRAMTLLLYTTQRRSDVHLMGRHNEVANGTAMRVVQVKGRKGKPPVELVIPIHPALKAELDLAPKDDPAYIMSERGGPYSTEAFTKWFVTQAKLAGLEDRTPHGLRKAGARMFAEAGTGAHGIAAMTGHKTLSEVERYTRSADQKRLAEGAMSNLISDGV